MLQFINVIFFLFLLFMQWPDLYKILVICEQEYNVYLKKLKVTYCVTCLFILKQKNIK